MQGRTIAVKVTGGDMVELNVTGQDIQRVIVDVTPVDVSLGLAGQLSEVTAMLDRISAALGVRRAIRRRRYTRKAAQTASCRMPRS